MISKVPRRANQMGFCFGSALLVGKRKRTTKQAPYYNAASLVEVHCPPRGTVLGLRRYVRSLLYNSPSAIDRVRLKTFLRKRVVAVSRNFRRCCVRWNLGFATLWSRRARDFGNQGQHFFGHTFNILTRHYWNVKQKNCGGVCRKKKEVWTHSHFIFKCRFAWEKPNMSHDCNYLVLFITESPGMHLHAAPHDLMRNCTRKKGTGKNHVYVTSSSMQMKGYSGYKL